MMGYQKAQRGLACVHMGPSTGVFDCADRGIWLPYYGSGFLLQSSCLFMASAELNGMTGCSDPM